MKVVSSVGRAFEFLEYFRVERRPLSLKAMVDHFGYPLVSTADILKTLLHLGYLSFDVKSKTYLPTPRLFELSSWLSQDLLDPFDLMKDLHRFHDATGLAVLLGTTNDVELQTIVNLEAGEVIYGRARRCLFTSGTGVALLSALDDEIIERLYRLAATRNLFDRNELSLAKVRAEIAAVRLRGYIASRNCLRPGRMVVAMPLPVTYSGRRLALGCSGPADEIEPRIAEIAALMTTFVAHHFGESDGAARYATSAVLSLAEKRRVHLVH